MSRIDDGPLPTPAAAAVARARLRLSELKGMGAIDKAPGGRSSRYSTPPATRGRRPALRSRPLSATTSRAARDAEDGAAEPRSLLTSRQRPTPITRRSPARRSPPESASRRSVASSSVDMAATYEADIASLVRENEEHAVSLIGQEAELASSRAKLAAQQDTIRQLTAELTHEHRLVEDLMTRNANAPVKGALTGSRRSAPRAAGGARAVSKRLLQQPRRGTEVLTHQLEQKHDTIIQLTSDNQRLHQRLRDQEDRAAHFAAQRDEAEQELSSSKSRLREFHKVQDEHAALQNKYEEVCAMVTELVSDKERLLGEKEALEHQLAEARREIARLRGRTHALDNAIAEGADRAANAVSRALDASEGLAQAREELERMRRRAVDAEARLESTKAVHANAIKLLNQSHVVEYEQSNAQIATLIEQLRRVSVAVAEGGPLPSLATAGLSPATAGTGRMTMSEIGAQHVRGAPDSLRTPPHASRHVSMLSPDVRSRLTVGEAGSPVTETVIALSEEGVQLAGKLRQQLHENSQLKASLSEEQRRGARDSERLERTVQSLQHNLDAAAQRERELEAKWAADAEAHKKLQGTLEREAQHRVEQIRQLKAEKQQLELKLEQSRHQIGEMTAKQSHMEGEFKNVAGMMTSASSEVTTLERQLQASKDEVSQLRSLLRRQEELDHDTALREKSRMSQFDRAAEQAAARTLLEQDLRRARAEVEGLKSDLQVVKQQLHEAQRTTTEERAQNGRLQVALTTAKSARESLEAEIAHMKQQTSHNSSAFESQIQRLTHDARGTVLASQSDLTEARLEISNLKRDLQTVAAEKGHLQTEIMRLKSELTSAHERYLSEQKARQAVYSELEATRASAASLRSSQLRSHALVPSVPAPSARVFELEQQIRVLRSQLATATSEAERARDTNSAASVAAMQLQAKERGLVTELEGLRTKVQIQADTIQRLESQCGELRGQASRMTLQLNLLREQHSKLVAEGQQLLGLATASSQPRDVQKLEMELRGHKMLVDKLSARNAELVQQLKQSSSRTQ